MGEIEKIYLFQYENIRIATLQQIDNAWRQKKDKLQQQNASSFPQILSRLYQTKRLEFNELDDHQINNTEQRMMRQIMFGTDNNSEEKMEEEPIQKTEEKEKEIVHFAVIARTSGTLQIFKIPEFKLVFECSEIQIGHQILKNNLIHDESLEILLSKHQLAKRKNLKIYIEDAIKEKL